jgi:LysM repeat protein
MATRVRDVPRVDLGVEGGNRGYLVGTPPPSAGPSRTTRQMVETDVEIPSFYKPAKRASGVGNIAPPEIEQDEPDVSSDGLQEADAFDTYVVQKGDSLWSISAKPEVYGKASGWRRIFEANRDLLKSPDRVKVGMTLKIPRDDEAGDIEMTGEGRTWIK